MKRKAVTKNESKVEGKVTNETNCNFSEMIYKFISKDLKEGGSQEDEIASTIFHMLQWVGIIAMPSNGEKPSKEHLLAKANVSILREKDHTITFVESQPIDNNLDNVGIGIALTLALIRKVLGRTPFYLQPGITHINTSKIFVEKGKPDDTKLFVAKWYG